MTHEASDRGTLGRGNPQVGGSSVEDDLELLRRGTDSDRSIVLGVHVVYDQSCVFLRDDRLTGKGDTVTTFKHPLLVMVITHHHSPELLPGLLINLREGRHLPTLTSETHQRFLTHVLQPLGSLETKVLVLQELGFHLWRRPEIVSIRVEGSLGDG